PDAPVCYLDVCVGCTENWHCGPDAPVCDAIALTCGECVEDADCAAHADTPLCDGGACVACRTSADCGAESPVCDAEARSCRACEADSECQSGICEEEPGACVAVEDILYVEVGGDDTGNCTPDAPCGSLTYALTHLTPARKWILMGAGRYTESATISQSAVILPASRDEGDAVEISGASTNQPVINIEGGAEVAIERLVIRDAPGTEGGHGIRCAGSSTLTLSEVQLTGNGRDGMIVGGCQVEEVDSDISGNANLYGISVDDGQVTATRSTLSGNNAGARVGSNVTASLTLRDCEVTDNLTAGLIARDGAELLVENSRITGNGGTGVRGDLGATLTVRGSTIAHNNGGVFARN